MYLFVVHTAVQLSAANFVIDYISTFHTANHIYWVTQQNKSETNVDVGSHLARICRGDKTFKSYTELPLECKIDSSTILKFATAAVLHPAGKSTFMF